MVKAQEPVQPMRPLALAPGQRRSWKVLATPQRPLVREAPGSQQCGFLGARREVPALSPLPFLLGLGGRLEGTGACLVPSWLPEASRRDVGSALETRPQLCRHLRSSDSPPSPFPHLLPLLGWARGQRRRVLQGGRLRPADPPTGTERAALGAQQLESMRSENMPVEPGAPMPSLAKPLPPTSRRPAPRPLPPLGGTPQSPDGPTTAAAVRDLRDSRVPGVWSWCGLWTEPPSAPRAPAQPSHLLSWAAAGRASPH